MDKIFDQLDRFIRSPLCVFEFNSIDYPTEFQQHLITSYYSMDEFFRTQPVQDIIRLLHTSDKYLDLFIPGLLYQTMLNPSAAEQHFETFMPSLRSQSWIHLGKLLLRLLQDSFLWIKTSFRPGVIPLLSKLHVYGQLEVDLVVLAIKTIDYTDLSQNAFNYNNQMLLFFHKLLTSQNSQQYSQVLAKNLFYKIFRMLSLLICVDDQALRDYKLRLVAIAERLFEMERQKCLVIGNSGVNMLKELQREELLAPLYARLIETLEISELVPQLPASAAMRLSAVLPLSLETSLIFIIKEGLSKMEIKIQMNWVFSQNGDHSTILILDILRYILALPSEDLPVKQSLYILEWLLYRVCSHNILCQIWKDQLFFPCFADPCPFPHAPQRVVRFLAYILQIDTDLGQTLLIFLLHHHGGSNRDNLRVFLLKANELQLINLTQLLNEPILRPRTREQLMIVMGHQSVGNATMVSKQEVRYYDPLQPMNRKQSQMSLQFSESETQLLIPVTLEQQ